MQFNIEPLQYERTKLRKCNKTESKNNAWRSWLYAKPQINRQTQRVPKRPSLKQKYTLEMYILFLPQNTLIKENSSLYIHSTFIIQSTRSFCIHSIFQHNLLNMSSQQLGKEAQVLCNLCRNITIYDATFYKKCNLCRNITCMII